MKAVLALLLVVAASSARQTYDLVLVGGSLDELMKDALEYIRFLLKRHDPYSLPPLTDQKLVDTNVDILFSADNVKWSKGGEFTIDKMSNNLPQLKASFQISSPTEYFEGNYKVSGTAFQKNVQGSGTFRIDVQRFVQLGDVQYGVVDHSLQVLDFDVDFSFGILTADVTGLTIDGMTEQEVKDFFSKQLLRYVQEHKTSICQNVANHVKEIANKAMKGKSLGEVLDFLKMLIASTPDPPPFEV